MPVTSSKNTHPLAWGTIDGPKGADNNSLASKMASKALKKTAEQKAADELDLWLARLEREHA